MNRLLSALPPSDQKRVALGNCMKNKGLEAAVLDGKEFTRDDRRAFWAALRRKRNKFNGTRIHLSF